MPFEGRLFFPDDSSSPEAPRAGRPLESRAASARSEGGSGELPPELEKLGDQLSQQAGQLAVRYPSSQRRASTFAAAIASRAKASSRRRLWMARGAVAAAATLLVCIGAARFFAGSHAPVSPREAASAALAAVAPSRPDASQPAAVVGGSPDVSNMLSDRLEFASQPMGAAEGAVADATSEGAARAEGEAAGSASPEMFDAFFEVDGSIREAIVDLEQDGQLERASFSL